ncbi:hypothetical protein Xen7305DRAFT_00046520 [Xenococcus sp. PCC 7305]|uniref:hypothetical protein n=1 Tax=Xenococcus sp. PCC 7305 TaxID=102125 RepID=UPI0002ACAB5A|nr:hypothetical protein [Xenococcus sp. PCC 7305]ELS04916.1 hypothetical protein Xen7305DRAFT_00046520 [Xenococcus sp. PCC 7305]
MPQAIQIVDDFGTWDLIGTLQPIYEEWIEYPDYSEALSQTTRLIFSGNVDDARSYAYIRVRYEITLDSAYGEWIRVYPKKQDEIILYPHPPEFGLIKINPRRFWQVQKRHWDRKNTGKAPDTDWNLRIEVCNEQITGQPTEAETEGIILGLI